MSTVKQDVAYLRKVAGRCDGVSFIPGYPDNLNQVQHIGEIYTFSVERYTTTLLTFLTIRYAPPLTRKKEG